MAEVTFAHLLEEQKKTNELLAKQRNPLDGRTGAGRALLESQRETTSAVKEGDKQTATDYIKQSAIEVFAEYDTYRREKKFKTDPKMQSQDDDRFDEIKKFNDNNVVNFHEKSITKISELFTQAAANEHEKILKNIDGGIGGLNAKVAHMQLEGKKTEEQKDRKDKKTKFIPQERTFGNILGRFMGKEGLTGEGGGLKLSGIGKFIGAGTKLFLKLNPVGRFITSGFKLLSSLGGFVMNAFSGIIKGFNFLKDTIIAPVMRTTGKILGGLGSVLGMLGGFIAAPFKFLLKSPLIRALGIAGLAFLAFKNFDTIRTAIINLAKYFDSPQFFKDVDRIKGVISNTIGMVLSVGTTIKEYIQNLQTQAEESLGFGFSDAIKSMKEGNYLEAGKEILSVVATMIGKGFTQIVESEAFRETIHNALNAILTPVNDFFAESILGRLAGFKKAGREGVMGRFEYRRPPTATELAEQRISRLRGLRQDIVMGGPHGDVPTLQFKPGVSDLTQEQIDRIYKKAERDVQMRDQGKGLFNFTDNSGNGGTTVNMNAGERVDDAVYVGRTGRNTRGL